MTEALPPPLVAADVDLRDMDGFMLNVERLMTSELWALSTGDEFKAAIGLWCRAWKQIPAASLPNSERILAAFAGISPTKWKKIKNLALRGFVLCSDGRLYHKVLAEDAKRAWERKCSFRDRGKRGNEKRWGSSNTADVGQSGASGQESRERSSCDRQEDVQGLAKEEKGDRDGTKTGSPSDANSDPLAILNDRQGQGQGQGHKEDVVDAGASPAERVLRSIGAWDDPNLRLHAGRLPTWLNAGADIDLDVIPTLHAVLASARRSRSDDRWFPSSLNFFDKPIADAIARRTKPMPEANPHGTNTRPISARDSRVSTDAFRGALAEVFADVVDDGGGLAGQCPADPSFGDS